MSLGRTVRALRTGDHDTCCLLSNNTVMWWVVLGIDVWGAESVPPRRRQSELPHRPWIMVIVRERESKLADTSQKENGTINQHPKPKIQRQQKSTPVVSLNSLLLVRSKEAQKWSRSTTIYFIQTTCPGVGNLATTLLLSCYMAWCVCHGSVRTIMGDEFFLVLV